MIAVDPGKHSAGLGKALSVAGLKHMAERGMRQASLYVDAANEKALAMYRAIGFEQHHLDRAYETDVSGSPRLIATRLQERPGPGRQGTP